MKSMSYSQFMGKLQASDVNLNRKVLADLSMNHPPAFEAILEKIKKDGSWLAKFKFFHDLQCLLF